jgi:hypothetical protein
MRKKIGSFIFLFLILICSPLTAEAGTCYCFASVPTTTADGCVQPCAFTASDESCICNIPVMDTLPADCNIALIQSKYPNIFTTLIAPSDFSCAYTTAAPTPPIAPSDTGPASGTTVPASGTTVPTSGTTGKASGTVPDDLAEKAAEVPDFLGDSHPDINVIVGRVIKYIIGIAGTATLVVFIYGGILWLTARGEAANVDKGKDAMKNAVIGLIILFSSYIIVKFIYAALTSAGA